MVEPGCQMDVNLTETNSSCNNQSFLIPYSQIVDFQFYAWGITGNIISALGLVGNILSLFVLANRRMQSSTSVYLMALSIFDSLVLISLTLFMALPAIYYETGALQSFQVAYPYLQPFAYPLALTAQTCSIYITVGFTIERFIAVCYPLNAAKWCTVERARKALAIIILASVIYNIPRWLEYHTVHDVDSNTNQTYATYTQTSLGENSTFRYIYFVFMHMFVMLLTPFVVLSALNFLLIKAVRHSAKAEGKVTNKQRRENNLTAMLIAVVVVFLICQVPSIVDNIFSVTMDDDTLATLPFVKVTCISSLMVIMNSAVNFYLYCVFGQKFRGVFCRIFCPFYKNKSWEQGTRLMNPSKYTSTESKMLKSKEPDAKRTSAKETNLFLLKTNQQNGDHEAVQFEMETNFNITQSPLIKEKCMFETQI